MSGVNKIILVGRLGADPDIRHFESGSKCATFSIATSETYKDRNGNKQEITDWHNIVIWGNTAEVVEKYLKKGSQVYLEGKQRTRSYEDKNNVRRYVTENICNKMVMLGGNASNGQQSNQAPAPEEPSWIQDQATTTQSAETDETDDLPF